MFVLSLMLMTYEACVHTLAARIGFRRPNIGCYISVSMCEILWIVKVEDSHTELFDIHQVRHS